MKVNHTKFTPQVAKKINEIVDTVPYYGGQPNIFSYNDINEIKKYEKEEIRENWERCMVNKNEEEIFIDYTSGSTGKPFKIARTKSERTIQQKYIWQYRDSLLNNAIVRRRVEFSRNMRYFLKNPDKYYLIEGNVLYIKGVLDKHIIHKQIEIINSFEPEWAIASASYLVQFVQLSGEKKITKFPGFIENAGEFLYPNLKRYLEKYFQCPVVNHYGSREVWPIALECKFGNMHILEQNVFLEIDNENDKGYGEILLTSLQISSMPLLRYRIGDIGRIVKKKCGCGSNNCCLELIGARANDYAISATGKRVGASFFSTIFVDQILRKGYKGILNWRIVQKSLDKFIVYMVVGNDFDSVKIENIITKYILQEFGAVSVVFEYIETLQMESNGKMRYFINELM